MIPPVKILIMNKFRAVNWRLVRNFLAESFFTFTRKLKQKCKYSFETCVAAPSLLCERSMVARLGRRESGIGGPGNKLWERFKWESLGRLDIKGGDWGRQEGRAAKFY